MTRQDLLQNLTVGGVLVCISVFIQVAFTLLVLKLFSRLIVLGERRPSYWMRALALTCLIFIIVADHLIQIHVWGSAFYLLSYFPDFWT